MPCDADSFTAIFIEICIVVIELWPLEGWKNEKKISKFSNLLFLNLTLKVIGYWPEHLGQPGISVEESNETIFSESDNKFRRQCVPRHLTLSLTLEVMIYWPEYLGQSET